MELVQQVIADYGYLAIFLMLVLGIVGIPIPDEVMMTVVGYFTNINVLNYELAILVSFVGALLGMLISYMIGKKAGRPFIEKYGKWIGLKEKRIIKVEKWMGKYGSYSLIFGYFIPGVRHITCYLSGISKMKLKTYILFAAIGAFLWCFVFITFGRVIGVIHE
ncbi:DedA family protein [Bacillus cereus]|uniref:DedA family protein n=1 Tax=unclassified Bacillus (in: firmicutes) TaxID=185979 RepID=UPI00047CC805|nr:MULTISPECIES: DedA family protein [unclassified Bacillus (in: firmicutes)]PFE04971.1 DedA family protein [Bacillus sp. AFS023182]PGX99177.1 DedA family protein [Bacillus cereus]SDZ11688.1 membrane protein DedA, SNARE-associated domain [Bacillus sp. 166amftsu]